jgi:hypothetical protein
MFNQDPRPSPESVKCTIFKPCEAKCTKCNKCKAFKKVLSQIDLDARSKHSMMTPRDWQDR